MAIFHTFFLSILLLPLGSLANEYRQIDFTTQHADFFFTANPQLIQVQQENIPCDKKPGMSIASDEDLNIQFDLMALDLKQAAQMKIPNFSLMHNLISKLEQQESPQQSQQNQQQQQKNQNQEDQLKFVWVNLLDFTIVGYDNTQLTGDYQLFPFIPNWIVPLDSNNVPLWDMEDMPQQQWDFENPPQKPDGTQWFDPQNLPKFQFVGQRFYPFIFKSHDTVDTEHPFYFVAVQLKDSKLKVLWKANLKEDGVFIVPFSNKFFTVEGQTIESTTWWDFKNPPTLSGQNSPLWTGNVQTTYPVFLFDKTKFGNDI